MLDRLAPPELEFAFQIRLEFGAGPRLRFEPAFARFTRGFVSVLGGTVEGPLITGRVVGQSGGDWPRLWDSGLIEFEAHYVLEASDGTPIYVHNRGVAYAPPETMSAVERGEQPARAPYCRVTPRFEAPAGPHEWLMHKVLVGTGERRGDHSIFDYYVVT